MLVTVASRVSSHTSMCYPTSQQGAKKTEMAARVFFSLGEPRLHLHLPQPLMSILRLSIRSAQAAPPRVRTYAKAAESAPASSVSGPSGTSRSLRRFLLPSTKAHDVHAGGGQIRSAAEAGTPLKGINYLKDQPAVLARPDEDYPEWLWRLLDVDRQAGATAEEIARREASKKRKADIKAKNFLKSK